MKIKELGIGDKVKLKTRDKEWEGSILESYDSEIVLLKLESGYNIGVREGEIVDVKVISKYKETEKEKSCF